MEQKRRTISTSRRNKKSKNFWKTLGIIIALILLFIVSFKIANAIINSGKKNDVTQSNEKDYSNMSRDELIQQCYDYEKEIDDLKAKIEMLENRDSGEAKPAETPKPEDDDEDSYDSDDSGSSETPEDKTNKSSSSSQTETEKPSTPTQESSSQHSQSSQSSPQTSSHESSQQPQQSSTPPAVSTPDSGGSTASTPLEDLANMPSSYGAAE